jgi:hypothetical protein
VAGPRSSQAAQDFVSAGAAAAVAAGPSNVQVRAELIRLMIRVIATELRNVPAFDKKDSGCGSNNTLQLTFV